MWEETCNRLVEIISKCKMGECTKGLKEVNLLVEFGAKSEVGEGGWERLNGLIEKNSKGEISE